jgi:hypothetical protein
MLLKRNFFGSQFVLCGTGCRQKNLLMDSDSVDDFKANQMRIRIRLSLFNKRQISVFQVMRNSNFFYFGPNFFEKPDYTNILTNIYIAWVA